MANRNDDKKLSQNEGQNYYHQQPTSHTINQSNVAPPPLPPPPGANFLVPGINQLPGQQLPAHFSLPHQQQTQTPISQPQPIIHPFPHQHQLLQQQQQQQQPHQQQSQFQLLTQPHQQQQQYPPPEPLSSTSSYHNNTNSNNIQYVRLFRNHLNPYYAVNLKFLKDLNTMTKFWTNHEIENLRRLVKFNFKSEGSTQMVNFEPITPEQYDNVSPIISCIYWKEKSRYISTSVDIITLLEYMVKQTFDVDEKNRIRRNLQSLKPTTISRINKNDRRFFDLIMSMENPRPRNIEKDLKVFDWSDLGRAVQKVMSKYYVVPSLAPTTSSSFSSSSSFQHPNPQQMQSMPGIVGNSSQQQQQQQPLSVPTPTPLPSGVPAGPV